MRRLLKIWIDQGADAPCPPYCRDLMAPSRLPVLVVRVVPGVTVRGKFGEEAAGGAAAGAGATAGAAARSRFGSKLAFGSGLPAISDKGSALWRHEPSKKAPTPTASTS